MYHMYTVHISFNFAYVVVFMCRQHAFSRVVAEALRLSAQKQHLAFTVSMLELLHFDPALAYHVLQHPLPLLEIFDTALHQLVLAVRDVPEVRRKIEEQSSSSLQSLRGAGGGGLHIRLVQLPPTPDISKTSIGCVRTSTDSQHLMQVTGTVMVK